MYRLVGLVLVGSLTLPAQAQDGVSKVRFLKWFYQDAVGLVQDGTSPRTIGYAAGTAALLIPLSRLDEQINPAVQEYDRGRFHDFLTAANELGNWKVVYPAAGMFAATLATRNTRLQDAAFTSLQSVLFASKITEVVKYAVGRSRPAVQAGAHTFDPFSGHNSFPSGHTTAAFALVTPWVLYYPHPVTYGLFALSTGTAVARLAHNAHWATDVAAGGAIGFVTAYYLTKRHGGLSDNIRMSPISSSDSFGLTMRMTF